jgi:DNA polymerase-1
MTRIFFDLEGDGFLENVTKLHCIETIDVDTGEERSFGPDEIEAGVAYIDSFDIWIAHNGLRYDFPVLRKLYGKWKPLEQLLDTLVLARLKHPDIKDTDARWNKTRRAKGQKNMGEMFGKHSIEAWGVRFGVEKVGADITDWSVWTPLMQERCKSDTQHIGMRLWKKLGVDKMPAAAILLEHRTAVLCDKITAAGWPFNERAAAELHAHLTGRKAELEAALVARFGSWWAAKGETWTPKKPDKTRGYWGHFEDDPQAPKGKRWVGYPLTKIERITFNPRSRPHVILCLKKLGWEPEAFTPGGDPKLDEEVIEGLASKFPQSEGLVEYLMVCKRLGQLADGDGAWLKLVKNGRIHAVYNPMGAVTSRASHFNPNIAQVPKSSSPYGKECRGLFCVPDGWEAVGADMSGLELKCLAHYMAKYDNGAYGELLDGDVHWANVLAMGFFPADTQRDKHNALHTLIRETGAKTFLYAWLYGCGDQKAGRIILDACRGAIKMNPEWRWVYELFFGNDLAPSAKKLKDVGSKVKNEFLSRTTGLAKLIQNVKYMAGFGTLPGLDNRRLPIRSDHAALNTLLQAAGALLCKQWICDAHDALEAEGLKWGWDGDFVFLGWIHDELQVACRNGLGERIGRVLTACAQQAGRPFGFRIRLDSDYSIGSTWADTH